MMPVVHPLPLAPHVPRESPTPTPYPTPTGTPSYGVPVCSPEPASFPIAKLEELARTHGKQVPVNISDGSATVPAITKLRYLAIYFAFNLGLTLFNKAVMIQVCKGAFITVCGVRRRRRFRFLKAAFGFSTPAHHLFRSNTCKFVCRRFIDPIVDIPAFLLLPHAGMDMWHWGFHCCKLN